MLELYVEDQPVDIDKGWSTLLNLSVDDIREPGAKTTTFSKTIVLPGTARNNRIFGHIFAPQSANEYNDAQPNFGANFNPARRANCIAYSNSMQILKGCLQILKIIEVDGVPEYEVHIVGELRNLMLAIGNKYLTDLDWNSGLADYALEYSVANILNSWTLGLNDKGPLYPLIDYGGYSINKKDWDIRTFKPALKVKDYVDRIFSEAGYRYDCPLFETDWFKSLIIPYNKKTLTFPSSMQLDVSGPAAEYLALDAEHAIFESLVDFGTGTTRGMELDPTYPPTVWAWMSGPSTVGVFISLEVFANIYLPYEITLTVNNVNVYAIAAGPGPYLGLHRYNVTIPSLSLNTGDLLAVRIRFTGGHSTASQDNLTVMGASLQVYTTAAVPIDYTFGDTLNLRDIVPGGIKQMDFLTSLFKLFNLYLTYDTYDERLFYIKPYTDFYSEDSQNAVDWTDKVDRAKPMEYTPMSELGARYLEFKYKDDSDYYNDMYKKRYNETYGSRVFDSGYDFSGDKQTVELIFAGTPLVSYAGHDKYYSTILKQSGTGASLKEEQVDSCIRILQTKYIADVETWTIDHVSPVITRGDYLYAGHLDDPMNPTVDLNFGAPKELFCAFNSGTLSENMGNVHWSPYLAEITDGHSKHLTCTVYLTSQDIANLDFRRYVYIDGVLYTLKKIIDWNASSPDTCKVELLKRINTMY